MNINATLIGQLITFAIFVWFTVKFIWPYITQAMEQREKKISDGLAAAEQGQRELEAAEHKATEKIRDAKIKAGEIVEQANQRANRTVEDAKEQSRQEGNRMINLAQQEIEQMRQETEAELRDKTVDLAVEATGKLIQQQMDQHKQAELVKQIISEI
jgi:F-type H+-transporting ATPase subunit b